MVLCSPDLLKKLKTFKNLLDKGGIDPPNDPSADFETMLELRKDILEQAEYDETCRKALLSNLALRLGIFSRAMQHCSDSESYINESVTMFESFEEDPRFVITAITCWNQLSIIWSERNDIDKAMGYLTKSRNLYHKTKKAGIKPFVLVDLFRPLDQSYKEGSRALEEMHTLTLYYLAQVYKALGNDLTSALFCHATLRRQLNSPGFDQIDWSANSANLAMYLVEKNFFKEARHHLAAATCVMNSFKETASKAEDWKEKEEDFNRRSADLARCWAHYGTNLLAFSKERLLKEGNPTRVPSVSDELVGVNGELGEHSIDEDLNIQDLRFESLNLDAYESQVTDKPALDFDDARLIFLNVQSWIEEARKFFTSEGHASDHADIALDHSQLFSLLVFFEDNPERQCKIHKRRINILEPVADLLNPRYYRHYSKQLRFEIGDVYTTMIAIKKENLEGNQPSPHALNKINKLASKGIFNFDTFIDLFNDDRTGQAPETVEKDFEILYLRAHTHICLLYSSYIAVDKRVSLENSEKASKYYERIIEYCNKNENAAKSIKSELAMCKEISALLPQKLAKLRLEAGLNN